MATFAIGDIHGDVDALHDLLEKIEPDIGPTDEVVFLGDYIDRGPDSKGCIDTILAFRDRRRGQVTCLRGNHEEFLLRTMADFTKHSWLLVMEALPTIKSYSEAAALVIEEGRAHSGLALYLEQVPLPYDLFLNALPQSHREFLDSLALVHATPDAICVHAGLDPAIAAIEDQSPRTFTWGATGFPEHYTGELPVVYGHFNNAVIETDGWPRPRITAHTIGIDTISHGVLTAVRLPERHVFQSRRRDGLA